MTGAGSRCTPGGLRGGLAALDGPAKAKPEPGFAELLRSLIDDVAGLFRQELRLARREITDTAKEAARNTASIAVGGAIVAFGAAALLAAAVAGLWVVLVLLGLSNAVAVWLAPLVVGVVVAGVGYAMIRKGLRALRCTRIVPEKTTQSLKETGRWMHAKVS